MTPFEIELVYRDEMKGKFPYEDCAWLQTKVESQDLIADLNWYFASIAGFASTASRLELREPVQLRMYLPLLRKEFFETYPAHTMFKQWISSETTPQLHRNLTLHSQVRSALIPIFESVLKRRNVDQAQEAAR